MSQQDLVKRRLLNGATVVRRKNGTHHYQIRGGNVLVDAAGTRRRLQALCAIGYSWKQIGDRLGMNRANVAQHAKLATKVWPRNAEKARALYEELSMIPAQHDGTKNLAIARNTAKRYGFVSALGWDDDTIDNPYALPVGLTHSQAFAWFWGAATPLERIEWVLEHGLSITRWNQDWKYTARRH